jgi:hypothetical protein
MRTASKLAGLALLLVGMATLCPAFDAPEIDPSMGANALALLAGAAVLIRARRK